MADNKDNRPDFSTPSNKDEFISYEVTTSKEDLQKQKVVNVALVIFSVLLIVFSGYKVNQLEKELHQKEADYKLLLKICSEQR